ncbi:CbtA family protein [Robbsia andropogonis]|uniref:CbtA family protein n=1 Tax=Robbsia andropogonis TaxID=28092 RepID=UPI0004632909|nr:CbtA family protein [Robbsia andropogonis]
MVGRLLIRGMVAGIAAGLLAFGLGKIVGEPQVNRASAFESAEHAHDGDHEEELISRHVQSGLGLATGVLVFGTAVGGLFSLTFAFCYGRVKGQSPRALSAWLAVGAFVSLVIVPTLKYPANPPSIGDPETIGFRTGLFFLMLAISVVAMVFALSVRRAAVARWGDWNGSIVAGALYCAIIVAVQGGLPTINEVPATFPASTLWQFRVASIGMQAVVWTTLGLLFGILAERVIQHRNGPLPAGMRA